MHAPRPTRLIPEIRTPPENMYNLNTRAGYLSPVAHLQGTQKRCVRHGRHDHVRQDAGAKRRAFAGTKDMLAKSRSGAYVPTGQQERRQMEATSPWAVPMDPLQSRRDELMEDAGACPDCLQELEIKRKEVYQESGGGASRDRYVKAGVNTRVSRPAAGYSTHSYAPASHFHSTEVEDPMDPDPLAAPVGVSTCKRHDAAQKRPVPSTSQRFYDPAWHATPYQPLRPDPGPEQFTASTFQPTQAAVKSKRSQPSPSTTLTPEEGHELGVSSKRLRDGLNAVIVEHEGRVRRVVLNKRSDISKAERLQRLSRDLASVAKAIDDAGAARITQAVRPTPQYSVVLDKLPSPPQTRDTSHRSSSIPELLSMIDQAAGEIHLDSSRDEAQHYVSHRRQSLAEPLGRYQSLVESDDMHDAVFDLPSPGEQSVHRQGMDEAINAARNLMANMRATQTGAIKPVRPTMEPQSATKQSVLGSKPFTVPPADSMTISTAAARPQSKPGRNMPTPDDTPHEDTGGSTFATPVSRKSTGSTLSIKPMPSLVSAAPAVAKSKPPLNQLEVNIPPSTTDTSDPTEPSTPAVEDPTPSLSTAAPTNDPARTSEPAHPSTPRALAAPLQPQSQPQSYFHLPSPHLPHLSLDIQSYNPFHRRTPQPSATSPNPLEHQKTATATQITDLFTNASKALVPPPIVSNPNPYHHAPAAPLGLFFGKYDGIPGLEEKVEAVREGWKAEKERLGRQAGAALEREARRVRRESAGALLGKEGRVVGRKAGWFG